MPGLGLSLVLLAVLVAVNAAAIWGILAARTTARTQAASDLELETRAQARAVEAALATLRGDVLFLAGSPPVAGLAAGVESEDPQVRRWRRLDVESALLLFLQAHSAVARVALRDAGGEPRVVAARAGEGGGVPTILPPQAPPPAGRWLTGAWSPGEAQASDGDGDEAPASGIAVWVDPEALVATAAPGAGSRLRLADAPPAEPPRGILQAAVPVVDEGWSPPVAAWLVREEETARRLASVESLASSYRTTVLVNLAVVVLTLAVATLTLPQIRRAARLDAERQQAARVRELERQLFHSERLASVGRLASGIAHEINNPLAGMSNYLNLLRDDLAGGDLAAAADHAARLREGIDRAAAVTRQVLAFAAPGKTPRSPVRLDHVLAETVTFVRSNPAFREVAVELEIGPEAADGVSVVGNATTLGQVFLNLLLNACQVQLESPPAEGAPRVDVALRATESGAVVAVADRGPGVDPEARRHLFEPFYSRRGSTGLGLSMCHGIVAEHQGRIEVHDRPGGGAVFEVRLPLAGREVAA